MNLARIIPASWRSSLRMRVFLPVMVILLAGGVVQAVLAYRTAIEQADRLFDEQMRQLALVLRLSTNANTLPRLEIRDFDVQVLGADGRVLYRSLSKRVVPASPAAGYSVVRETDSRYRVYALRSADRWIQVSQDLDARAERARAMAVRAALPMTIIVPIVLLALFFGIQRSLRPLERVRKEVAELRFGQFEPLSTADVPREALPLVDTMNKLFARLQRAHDAQAGFVADAAHELRTPLTALRLQLDNLRRAQDDEARESALAALQEGVQRSARLVDQMLELARQEAVPSADREVPAVEVSETAKAAVSEQVIVALNHDVDLGIHLCESGTVRVGEADLAIMWRNLIANAIQHAPAGSRVDVSVIARPDGIECVVEDAGPGIAYDARERVLERFSRGQSDGKGSGLGLAIVAAIARRHRGSVTLAASPRLGGLRASVRFATDSA